VSAAGRKLNDPFCAREYQKRTLPERELWRLVDGLKHQGALVYDLQFGSDQARHRGLALGMLDPGLSLEGFAATARVLAQLDLVITVDTAMAHLVGAMGKPGWVLLPWSADPRWLNATPTTPWYPSLRLFRQRRGGDWNGAVDQLLAAFGEAFPPYGQQ
jgi:ADP-heptose:LPS heptosyltransferase